MKKIEEKFNKEIKSLEELGLLVENFDCAIKTHIDAAKAELQKAVDISEKYGLPIICAGISFIYNSYQPKSFEEKFSEEERKILAKEFDIYENEYGYGWEHSAVC